MRAWPWAAIVLVLTLPAVSGCSWSSWPIEGRWGIWSLDSGLVEVVESPMFGHGTACEPYPPGHAIDGDLFVWAEPVDYKYNQTQIHVRKGGADVALWPVRTEGWRDVAHLGVADGIAYLVWDTRNDERAPPIGRLDLADGSYSEIGDPFPNTDPFWERLGGSVLWTTWPRVADTDEGVLGFDLEAGVTIVSNVTGSSLGLTGHVVWPLHESLGHGWVVFAAQDALVEDAKMTYHAYEFATGRLVPFDLPEFPVSIWSGDDAAYVWSDGDLLRVDLAQEGSIARPVPWPEVDGEERWGPNQVASAAGDKVVLAWFEAEEDDLQPSATRQAAGAAPLAALLVTAVAWRIRARIC